MPESPPVVLCFSGHDPTGGAGLQADIETLSALGCRPCTVVTALTAQDTVNVRQIWPQRPEDLRHQARLLIGDLPITLIKIGLLGSAEVAHAVADLLERELAGIPVVLDPVLAAGGGQPLAREDLVETIKHRMLPLTRVATPNVPEAQALAGGVEALDDCAAAWLRLGCRHVLLTGTHADTEQVVNRLYGGQQALAWSWPRLPAVYHGSGCTLASALAAGLALGNGLEEACGMAQQWTWEALNHAFRLGKGQSLPNRVRL